MNNIDIYKDIIKPFLISCIVSIIVAVIIGGYYYYLNK